MSILVVTKKPGAVNKYHLSRWHLVAFAAVVLALMAAIAYGSYRYGQSIAEPDPMITQLRKELATQQATLEEVRRRAEENMNALAMRMGELKSHIIRLDALGERLIEMADLDKGEFDFRNPPAQGGPAAGLGGEGRTMAVDDFLREMDELSRQIESRALQLDVLESLLMSRNLQDEVFPTGRPVKRGWISSYFGYRTDPFTGRIAHHDGIDIAGKEGSDVVAVAAGVVTWAGPRYGYGKLVEINHGNGYVTRYGHNKEILVKVGDTVKKGQVISKMGSTGRSTGPHVHFEVHKNGKVVDPIRYVRAAR